jgi:hypothetical protein
MGILVGGDSSVSGEGSATAPIPETYNNKTYNTDAWFRNKTVQDRSLFHGMFTYNIPESTWYEMIDDVEQSSFVSATSVDGKAVLATGALNVKRQLRSFRCPRYEPNRGHLYSSSIFYPNKEALAERSHGVFTSESGVGFRLRAGVLYAFRRSTVQGVTADIEEVVTIPDGVDLDKGNVYDIQFQWRGVGSYFFYINLKLVHTMEILGTLSELSVFNPALPLAFEAINQGDLAELVTGCVDVTSEGGDERGKTYGAIATTTVSGSVAITGFNVPILVVRSKNLVGGLINTREVVAILASAYSDQRSVFRIWTTRNPAAITLNNQSWSDFRDGHLEYIEYDNPDVVAPITFNTALATLQSSYRVDQDITFSANTSFSGGAEIFQNVGDIVIFTVHRETGTSAKVGVTYEFAEAI